MESKQKRLAQYEVQVSIIGKQIPTSHALSKSQLDKNVDKEL